jgi:hypothetical protein
MYIDLHSKAIHQAASLWHSLWWRILLSVLILLILAGPGAYILQQLVVYSQAANFLPPADWIRSLFP